MFGSRKSSHSLDEPIIELMVAWDEYCLAENPEGFDEDVEKAKESWGNDLHEWRVLDIEIDEKDLRKRFGTSKLQGTVKDGDDWG